jgi:hypothetical protein
MRQEIGRRIPVLIIADCEPDLRQTIPAHADPWIGFQRFFEFMSAQRRALAAQTHAPARFSWFWRMDRQIELTYGSADWAVRTYAAQIAEAERWGDETGLHAHAWRWDAALDRWIADHGNPAWIASCLHGSFAEYERVFGRICRVFRFGDGWLDETTLGMIERSGVRIDLTVEPGLIGRPSLVPEEASSGSIPDRRSVPLRPYHPSRTDFRRPDRAGDTGLWILLVTTGAVSPHHQHRNLLLDLWSWIAAPRLPTIQLNLGIDPDQFLPIFHRAVSRRQHPYAAVCVRTDVGANDGLMACVERNLHEILNHELADRFTFTTPTEALTMLID